MPDRRRHRGPHPDDERLFAPAMIPVLRTALADFCWLLDRDYAVPSALKLVGDRYQLEERQRLAIFRSACSEKQRRRRSEHGCSLAEIAGARLIIDGYNVLTTVEAALSGGVLLLSRDGCLRDLASMHGTYRKVEETLPALELCGDLMKTLDVTACHWLLDSPVSNSGRLKQMIELMGQQNGWSWSVELVANPDGVLAASQDIVVTADSAILDRCEKWFNFVPSLLAAGRQKSWVVDLSKE